MFARIAFGFPSLARCFAQPFSVCRVLRSTVEIRMPSLSPTMTQGNIVKWHKREGDSITAGDLLCEIQTDKAVMAFEVEEEGTLAKILKDDNSNEVPIGTLIALIAEEGTDWKSIKIPEEDADAVSNMKSEASIKSGAQKILRSNALGPAAKILIHRYNVDVDKIESTGPRGITLKSDVMKYIKEKGLKRAEVSHDIDEHTQLSSPKVSSSSSPVNVSSAQIPIDHSKHNHKKIFVPHSYSTIDVSMDSMQKRCEEFKKIGINVHFLDILVKAAAIALKKFPHLNAQWVNEGVLKLSTSNISFSMDVDDSHVFQEIKDASSLSLEQISSKINEFKTRASSNDLPDMEGSSSSLMISYLGNVDVTSYHGVVFPPYISCLSFVAPRHILDENCCKKLQTTLSMSVDNRAVDDVDATIFLEHIKQLLENPSMMISQSTVEVDLQKLFAK